MAKNIENTYNDGVEYRGLKVVQDALDQEGRVGCASEVLVRASRKMRAPRDEAAIQTGDIDANFLDAAESTASCKAQYG